MGFYKYETLPIPLRMCVLVFRRFWFVWCSLIFLVTGFIAAILYALIFNLFSYEKAIQYTHYVTRLWSGSLLFFFVAPTRISGAERLDANQNYVIISNHLSAMDIPINMYACPQPFSFLAKIEADKVPFVGYLARNMHVYVDRKNEESRKNSYQRMVDHVSSGRSIHIYAEGTRNRGNGLLGKFYDGAFKLAIQTQTPIAIQTIMGSDKVLTPKYNFQASPGFVHCVWDEPIPTKGMTMADLERLKAIVRDRILANLEAYQFSEHYRNNKF